MIAKVYDLKTVTAQMLVSEKEIAAIQVGQKVELRVRAHPRETFRGTVTSIATSVQESSSAEASSSATSNKTFVVTTEIDNESLLLKAGMTGQAKIFCGRKSVLDLVSRRATQTLKVDFWSFW